MIVSFRTSKAIRGLEKLPTPEMEDQESFQVLQQADGPQAMKLQWFDYTRMHKSRLRQ